MKHLPSLSAPLDYTVAVDIDGVVYELLPALRQRAHRILGIPLHMLADPTIYDIETAWRLPKGFLLEQLILGVQEGDVFWQGDAHLPGLNGLRDLKTAGYRVVLVSARDLPGVEDLCFEATEHWLSSVGAVYDELILTTNKTDVAWDFLVDDYEKNVLSAHQANRGAVLLNRGWNATVNMEQAAWEKIPSLIERHRERVSTAA